MPATQRKAAQHDSNIAAELAALKSEMLELRSFVGQGRSSPKENTATLRVTFSGGGSPRLPFICHIRGEESLTLRLSSVRYAIYFALFVDIYNRSKGGAGLEDLKAWTKRCYSLLQPVPDYETLRVASYRAYAELAEHGLNIGSVTLITSNGRLYASRADRRDPTEKREVNIELTVEEPLLAPLFNECSEVSFVDRVRAAKALFVPQGSESIDHFLRELFEQKGSLKISALYFRLANMTYPREFLERMGACESLLSRHDIAQKRLRDGSLKVIDVVPMSSLWRQIRINSEGEFVYYPPGTTKEGVIRHFDHLIQMMDAGSYSLLLTSMDPPFYFVTYEAVRVRNIETFTLFPRREESGLHDISALVLYDTATCQAIDRNVLLWAQSHAGTLDKPEQVKRALTMVRTHLLDRGPLNFEPSQHPE